jgi:cytochrome bd-type quinol oxidase subunit 2
VFGVLGGNGVSEGFIGISGAGGIAGEVGGGGAFCAHPASAAAAIAATTVNRVAFIFALLSRGNFWKTRDRVKATNCALWQSVIVGQALILPWGKGQ